MVGRFPSSNLLNFSNAKVVIFRQHAASIYGFVRSLVS